MATVKWTHAGQYRPYGDTFRECEIYTDSPLSEEEILSLAKNGSKLPKEEWKKSNDICIYFTGWYTITKTDYGYKYVGCEPYTD